MAEQLSSAISSSTLPTARMQSAWAWVSPSARHWEAAIDVEASMILASAGEGEPPPAEAMVWVR